MTYPNSDMQSYTYEAIGDRLTNVHSGVTTSYTYDDLDGMILQQLPWASATA